MNENIKISCIIPTCDRNNFLIKAIRSVLAQTMVPDEIIAVNNGKEKLSLPADIVARVIVKNIEPYAGVSAARNFGARQAQGEFLAFLDDDDQWSEKYIESVLSAIKAGALCILNRMDKIENGKISLYKNPHGMLTLDNLFISNPGAGGSNLVISKKTFFDVGGFDADLVTSEDKSLIIEVIRAGIGVVTLPDNQIIASIHHGETGHLINKMSDGILRFNRKYFRLMTWRQYLYNWYRIFYFRYKSGDKLAAIPYFFLSLFYAKRLFLKNK